MTNRELETRYNQLKATWKHLVNANVELLDENKMLKEEIERLNNIINELEKDLEDMYYGRGKYHIDSDVIGIMDILDKINSMEVK